MLNHHIVHSHNVATIDWPKFFEKYNNGIVVLDFETTGFSPEKSRVIEVGAARVIAGKVVEQYSKLCNPECVVPEIITRITGINTEMLKNKPPVGDVILELQKFIGDYPIVAHNAEFEARFLSMEMKRLMDLQRFNAQEASISTNKFICTKILARHLIPQLPNYKLATLKEHIKFVPEPGHQAHRALSDVQTTVALWGYMHHAILQQLKCPGKPVVHTFNKVQAKHAAPLAVGQSTSSYVGRFMSRGKFM